MGAHLIGDDHLAHRAPAALFLSVGGREGDNQSLGDGGHAEQLPDGDDALAADTGKHKFVLTHVPPP
ncbi:hypothetical protein SDC9_65081 [bioreactor metagenome]|uniref:Uncharacterized protein n=1 Tax=bioreactor metagenome TaxID=1076179 RepID=A0A644XSF1_9ZZZZ